MIAAIDARKSTDQYLPDAEKSVTRQVEHATAYAAKKGWTVDPAHCYQDDGISGAEFVKRHGAFQREFCAPIHRARTALLDRSECEELGISRAFKVPNGPSGSSYQGLKARRIAMLWTLLAGGGCY